MKIAIIGAGITGLTAGYRLSQKRHQAYIFEKENHIGGLSYGFKDQGWDWQLENFFHHLFTSDKTVINLVKELGLEKQLFFTQPKSSIYWQGGIGQFDSPISVLKYTSLSLPDRIRTGLVTAYLKSIIHWQPLEKKTAYKWLHQYYGQKSFHLLWEPLLKSKFGTQAPQISMAWFWARIKKRSQQLGYLKGGFQVLIDKLETEIKQLGGQIYLNQEIKDLTQLTKSFDKVIITTPTQTFFKTQLPSMLGAVNLILVLKEKFLTDGTYWLNINEPGFPFVAVVEHTNFIDKKSYGGNRILYVGGYYPQTHRYFKMSTKQIFDDFLPHLQKINPKFSPASPITYHLSRSLFAQPIMPVNYSKIIPSMKTSILKVYLANMQNTYPWDRGINYAVEQGEKVVYEILNN
jgi:protoporphyrinogen oxidase